MYKKEFDSMRDMFKNSGRLEDSTLGAFEVILILRNVTERDIQRLKTKKLSSKVVFLMG